MSAQPKPSRPAILWSGSIIVAVVIAAAIAYRLWPQASGGDSNVASQETLALGQKVYVEACASCHGAKLEGQPDWRTRRESGRLPAPPHDATGHTWHHTDDTLFGITKYGPADFAGLDDYESDMPAFAAALSDQEIRAVLAYIKSTWPAEIRARQDDINRRNQQN